jgi:hypothetical protein
VARNDEGAGFGDGRDVSAMWRVVGLGLVLIAGAACADPMSMPMPAAAPAAPAAATPEPGAACKVAGGGEVTAVVGLTGKTLCLTPDVLKDLDRAEATMINHSVSHTYEGVRLTEILRLLAVPTGARLHADADRDYLVVTGKDGFRAVFSLAETDSSVQHRAVILADHMDGAPVDAHDAPFRIVVDGDQKPARSVYGVMRIEVKSLP